MKRVLPLLIGLAGLGVALLIACAVWSAQYWTDTACLSEYPYGPVPEASSGIQKLSVIPPKLTCVFNTRERGRVVVERTPL